MNTRILIALALGLSTTAYGADRSFERTLSVPAAPVVSVSTGAGFVHLHPGSDSQVHISAHLRANQGWFDNAGDVEHRMDEIVRNPPIQQNGNAVTIGARGNDSLYHNIAIDYDVTLPRASAIVAGSGSGEITLQDVGVNVKASTGSGNIDARGTHGVVSLQTGSGDIALDSAGGDASGVQVSIPAIGFHSNSVSGSSNGTGGTETRIQTGSGSIHVKGVEGSLWAQTGSGDMTIGGNPTADWRLQTGSGDIRLGLGSSARFNLSASTGSGSVHVAQPMLMQGSLNQHHVTGSVNGGGPTLKADTGSGNVEIR